MTKRIKYKGQLFRLEIWDTAGQEKFRSLVRGYLRGADACIFVYDCTSKYAIIKDPHSYKALLEWVNIFDELSYYNAFKLIVANKVDVRTFS